MKIWLFLIIVLLSLVTLNSVLAVNVTTGSNVVINPKLFTICLDAVTMDYYANWQICDNSYNGTTFCVDYTYVQPFNCQYGCDLAINECKEAPYITYLEVIIGIAILIIIFALVLRR